MRSTSWTAPAIAAFALAAGLASAARAGEGIVPISSGDGFIGPQVGDVSGDGRVAAGADLHTQGFRWSDGLAAVPDLPGFVGSVAWAVSSDGSVVVGTVYDGSRWYPFRWTASEGGALLDGDALAPGQSGSAWAVSADGSVVVGNVGSALFRWTAETGMVALGAPPGYSTAFGISGDGGVVTGAVTGTAGFVQAYRWTEATGVVGLGAPPDCEGSEARGISADGSTIVGGAGDEDTQTGQAFRWTASEGMVGLGRLPGTVSALALDVSGDGGVVVGRSYLADGITDRPFVWTPQTGMLPLRDFLATRGVALAPSIVDPKVVAVSDDGRVLALVDDATSDSYLVDVTPRVPALPLAGWWALGLGLAAGGRSARTPDRRRSPSKIL